MTTPCHVRKHAWLIPFAVCISTFLPLPARGQEPVWQSSEVKAVARITKQMIDDVAGRKEVVAAIPYRARVLGFVCEGVIDGNGKFAVDMTPIEDQGVFFVNGHGTAETYVRGVRGPIVAMGPAWGPFTTQSLVRFDGRKFSIVETTPWSEVNGKLERVEGRHGGRVGRALGRMMMPVGEHLVPLAERQATPIANYYLKNFATEVGEEIVAKLNRTIPVERSFHRLYPETSDWIFQMSTHPHFIQAAYGPPHSVVPPLPEHPGRPVDTRLELWLKTTSKEAQALEKLTKQPLAKQLVQAYLEATLPELAALSKERTVTAVGQWIVISIGAPKAD